MSESAIGNPGYYFQMPQASTQQRSQPGNHPYSNPSGNMAQNDYCNVPNKNESQHQQMKRT